MKTSCGLATARSAIMKHLILCVVLGTAASAYHVSLNDVLYPDDTSTESDNEQDDFNAAFVKSLQLSQAYGRLLHKAKRYEESGLNVDPKAFSQQRQALLWDGVQLRRKHPLALPLAARLMEALYLVSISHGHPHKAKSDLSYLGKALVNVLVSEKAEAVLKAFAKLVQEGGIWVYAPPVDAPQFIPTI
ncbi:uncharacterized protein LOC135383892 isoform X2 [Ornithodoros turicata]|uniref:uncharacterized protein LOC135383892 isoform X2 n=1 Tax=Ornithodoros turicata TaxID=34597 RepID=UPI00313A05C6